MQFVLFYMPSVISSGHMAPDSVFLQTAEDELQRGEACQRVK